VRYYLHINFQQGKLNGHEVIDAFHNCTKSQIFKILVYF